ncbi:MAG: ABC transporter ATP-binding protein [Acetobacteraceae bacterium]|nr:ABC transporter ATP-binding protein [Acetobacteraceae bacterium]
MSAPLLQVEGLRRLYRSRGWMGRRFVTRAVDGVSFTVMPGETLGLVGESGSGKSTTGRLVLGLEAPDQGRVLFDATDLGQLSQAARKPFRKRMQVVFQDPYAALNPRMRVGEFVEEPLVVHGQGGNAGERRDRVADLFRTVGLDPAFMRRFPHEFSGGQRQRVGIARAIALNPEFLVADEPITALDVSIQAQIVNLFQDLQQQMGLALLFIAHDLSMVRYLCNRVAVMLKGRIVEAGPTGAVFDDARHPYTQALLSAVPVPDPAIERGRRRIPFDAGAFVFPPEATMHDVGGGHLVLQGEDA